MLSFSLGRYNDSWGFSEYMYMLKFSDLLICFKCCIDYIRFVIDVNAVLSIISICSRDSSLIHDLWVNIPVQC